MTTNIRSILVPTDFSPASDRAIDLASELAERLGASLHLIHVIDPLITSEKPWEACVIDDAGWHEHIYQQRLAALRTLAQELAERCIHASCEVRSGTAAAAIVNAAVDYGADLIVMSTHGRTGLPHLVLGSVAEYVMRHANCPVLTVRDKQGYGLLQALQPIFQDAA